MLALWSPALQAQPSPSTTVTTHLDSLPLENGYPTATAAAKLYDELDLQQATQAYLRALPAVVISGVDWNPEWPQPRGVNQIGELQARSCTMAGTSFSRGRPARTAS